MKSQRQDHRVARDHSAREEYLSESSSDSKLCRLIDATCLSPGLMRGDIEDLSALALKEKVRAVCVPPAFLADLPLTELQQAEVEIATVLNFPAGYQLPETVIYDAERVVREGATEIDFVQPVSLIKNQEWRRLEDFSRRLVENFSNITFKVILETGLLSLAELQTCIRCHALAGVNIIKTSTGFGPRGASVNDIHTIKNTLQSMGLGKKLGIKASGGISTRAFADVLIQAGATCIGTSKTSQLLLSEESP